MGDRRWLLGMKLERSTVSFDERELMDLEAIVQDGDKEAALVFLRELRKKIVEMQRRRMSGCL